MTGKGHAAPLKTGSSLCYPSLEGGFELPSSEAHRRFAMSCSQIRRSLFLAVISAGACFIATATRAADADASVTLDGTWKLVSVELEGEARQPEEDVRWIIKKDKVLYGGEPLAI